MDSVRDHIIFLVTLACISTSQSDHQSNKYKPSNAGSDLRIAGADLQIAGTDLRIAGTDLRVAGTHLQSFLKTLNNKYGFNYLLKI
jgi:hypothetical protein